MTSIDLLKVKGGKPLSGSIKAQGAKNAVTKLLIASLLSDKKSIFYNVPNIDDVQITVNLCQEIGAHVQWDKEAKIIEIITPELKTSYIPQRYSGANRIPILMIGALLGRTTHDIIVPTVGGDNLGKRPVDFHLDALTKLGATIEYRQMQKEGAYFAKAYQGLKGAFISFSYPSVGATENAILAACSARGVTTITNVAIEPEIIDLILYLQKLGVDIHFISDRTLRVSCCTTYKEVKHEIISDRNEIISYALAAISTKGKVFIEGAYHKDLISFLSFLHKVGAGFSVEEKGIAFFYQKECTAGIHIETEVHPGFMTDWQQPFVVLLTQSKGVSILHETVYENRFGYIDTLNQMGAKITPFIQCLGNECRFAHRNHVHSIVIEGATPLQGKKITIPDLRAGFAYVMAALLAPQTSSISNVHYLDRGYEAIEEKLSSLGAEIRRVSLQAEELSLSK